MSHPIVYLGLSGGVDSAVSAAMLAEQGFDVRAVFLKVWSGTKDLSGQCNWVEERQDALRVAGKLGIPFQTWDFEEQFSAKVVDYLFREYQAGRTPNPDIICNQDIKFGLFYEQALAEGADFVATGHYARVEEREDGYALLAGVDETKDQSYFLCRLRPEQLKHCLFPVGKFCKSEVRERARRLGLPVADKSDSMGICFVGQVPIREFLRQRLPVQKGQIVTAAGELIGEHDGVWFYTLGQRQGLGAGGGAVYYAVDKDVASNTLVVAPKGELDSRLYSKQVLVSEVRWLFSKPRYMLQATSYAARFRHLQRLQSCTVEDQDNGQAIITFDETQRAFAPGQFVAWYDGVRLVGSAVIERPLTTNGIE